MVVLKKIKVVKASCFMGIYGLFAGIIVDLFLMIYMYTLSSLLSSLGFGLTMSSLFTAGGGILYFILIPLVSGVTGFLGGLIFTPLTNLVLKITKGLDLDMFE